RRRRRWTEGTQSLLREAIDHAERERHLRADDGEVDLPIAGKPGEPFEIVGRERDAGRDVGDAGVPGRAPHSLHLRAPREPPGERVLAAAAADDAGAHARQCRTRRTPGKPMPTPAAP